MCKITLKDEECDHYKNTEWINTSYRDEDGNIIRDGYYVNSSSLVDIDVHRYQCTYCGLVQYYCNIAPPYYDI